MKAPPKSKMVSFRLRLEMIDLLYDFADRLSEEANTDISLAKAVELCLIECQNHPYTQLIKQVKRPSAARVKSRNKS